MTSENINTLSGDMPIAQPRDDRLGYASFAKHLAQSICTMIPTEGLVISIYGPWGSGKTSMLNLVDHYLRQKPKDEQLIIVRFNPWWFSGHEDLTRRFFYQLRVALSKWKHLAKDAAKHIADFADLISEAPIPYLSTGAKVLKRFIPSEKDIPELKEKIAEILKRQERRILVIIDDIDRLTAEEIRQLFRVIKAVADFPNIVYLLAFDKDVVIKALRETQGIPGEAYLEKIVQVPFELPLPDKTSIRQLFFEKLDAILADTPSELFDSNYWVNVYLEGIDHFIITPRDIVRLTNALAVTYPAVKGEVNTVDFIVIETLRIFCPELYDIIRKNPDEFTGSISGVLRDSRVDDLKTFHNSWINRYESESAKRKDITPIRSLLMQVFPKLKLVWGMTSYGSDWESKWRKQLRVCSPEIFPIYFRMAIPKGDISNSEMKAIVALAGNVSAFGKKLVELSEQKRPDGTTQVRVFFERLEDFTENDIPLDYIPSVIRALFDVGDQLLRPEDEPRGGFDFGNDIRIGRIIWQLLRRFDEPERFRVLESAISMGHAISIIVHEVAILGQQHGKYGANQLSPEGERLVSEQHLAVLENIALKKVQDVAKQNTLLQAPRLPSILYRWQDWAANKEEAKQWVQKVINDDTGLVTILEKFLQRRFSYSVFDKVEKVNYILNPQWLEPFFDSSEIIDRARNLAENADLTENQRIAVRQFIRGYEMMQQGKNPDSPFAWETE